MQCTKCGNEILDGNLFCGICGTSTGESNPTEEHTNDENLMEPLETPANTDVETQPENPPPKKSHLKIIIIIVCCIVFIGGIAGFFIYQSIMKQNKADDYAVMLSTTTDTMIVGAAEAESLSSLTYRVWYNTIYEQYNDETDPYTLSWPDKPGISYFNSVNTALSRLFTDQTTIDQINSIKKNQELVMSFMSELSNPSEDFEKCYDEIYNLYSMYQTYTDLAISPSGNFSEFSNSINAKSSDFIAQYKKVKTLIPENESQASVESTVA